MKFDKKFIEQLKKKDQQTHTDFYLKTVDRFYRYLKWFYYLQDDACNDVLSNFYIKFWNNIEKYNFNFSFETFIWTMFRNVTKDYLRKNKEKYFTDYNNEDYKIEDDLKDTINISEFLEKDFKQENIKKAISDLDELSRSLIYWRFVENKTYKEISELTNLTSDNIRQKVSRILKRLKKKLSLLE